MCIQKRVKGRRASPLVGFMVLSSYKLGIIRGNKKSMFIHFVLQGNEKAGGNKKDVSKNDFVYV